MDKEELKLKYDEQCKKIISIPEVLANITKVCIKEYQDLSIEEIVDLFYNDKNFNTKFDNVEDISIKGHRIYYDIF